MGIPENELADHATAAAFSSDISPFDIPFHHFKRMLRKATDTNWQQFWDDQVLNKLHLIKLHVGHKVHTVQQHFHEVLRHKLKTGHAYLSRGFLLRGEEPPWCTHCREQLSILHILVMSPQHELHSEHYFFECYKYRTLLHSSLLLSHSF